MAITLDGTTGITASGNITGNYILGNGSQLSGIITSVSSLSNGTSNVVATSSGGNVTVGVGGTPNVAVFSATGANIAGTFNATGNTALANVLIAASKTIDVGSNKITNVAEPVANSDAATKSYVDSATSSGFTVQDDTANTTVVSGGDTLQLYGTANEVTVAITTTDRVTFGLPDNVTVTGNITANYFLGNGSQLTGIDATAIQNGTSNVRVAASGNVTVSSAGIANVLTVTGTGANITGTLNATGNANVGNLGATTVVATTLTGTLSTAAQTNITSTGTLTALSVTGNVTSGNVSGTNGDFTNVSGNGSALTALNASNISTGTLAQARLANAAVTLGNTALTLGSTVTTVAGLTSVTSTTFVGALTGAATTAATVTTAAQPNITSVGTLTSVSVTGNITGGNLLINTDAVITGNLTVQGNTTTINSNVITTNDLNITVGNNQNTGAALNNAGIDVGNNNLATWRFNNATTSWQSNIAVMPTANGTLTLGGTSNYWGAAYVTSLTATGNVSTGNVSGTTGTFTNVAGTLATAAQTNITSVGTLGSLTVTGNIDGGNLVGTLNGSGANVTSINATNISSGTLAQARLANAAVTLGSTALTLGSTVTTVAGLTSVTSTTFVGALTGAATTAGTVTTAAQANITSVGTLTALTVSGAITVNSSNAVTAIVNGGTAGSGNIGSSGQGFNTIFAKATSAQYADLAEMYEADQIIEPGTVVCFGGTKEITVCGSNASSRVAGVVSTNPSYIMNSGLQGEYVVAVTLQGRVPVRVTGIIAKGDMMVATADGRARAEKKPKIGTVIGKALADFDGTDGVIEVVVGRV